MLHVMIHRLACPYSHQQNGKVERKHRHLTETGLALLATTSLPLNFWDEVFLIATYLINRLPSYNLSQKSPFELNNYLKPDYSFMKIFCCACYPYLRPYNSNKFDYKSHKCLFLGYAKRS